MSMPHAEASTTSRKNWIAPPSGWPVLGNAALHGFAGEVVREIHPGQNAHAYVIDADNHLVSHPNLRYVLRRSDLSALPQVAALRAWAQGRTVRAD